MRGPGDEVGWLKGSKECSKSIVKCCEVKLMLPLIAYNYKYVLFFIAIVFSL